MYIHIGEDNVIHDKEIVGIFDLDNASQSKKTQAFLNAAQKNGQIIVVGDDIPKTFIIVQQNKKESVFLTQISSQTLQKRVTLE